MTKEQNRQSLLKAFLKRYFSTDHYSWCAITSDASFRRYYRVVSGQKHFIVMDSDPSRVNNAPFVELNRCFSEAGLRVPRIFLTDLEHGFLLLEDLGQTHLADRLLLPSLEHDYENVLRLLPQIAGTPASNSMKPYDADFIAMEMDIFWQWLLLEWLGLDEQNLPLFQWRSLKEQLVSNILAQPQVTMHRDFHSRNIMYVDTQWALIDYQDAVQGPVTYDAVSLLRDCYFRLPSELFERLQKVSYVQLYNAKLLGDMGFESYCRYFDLTGVQRHLKAAGIFCRLLIRDGKSGYLKDVLPTLEYVCEVAKCYEPFQWLETWLRHDIMPKVEAKLDLITE